MFKSIAQFCAKIKLYFITIITKTVSDDDLKEIYQDQMKKILAKKDMDEMSKWLFITSTFYVFLCDHYKKDKTYPRFMAYCKKLDSTLSGSYKQKTELKKFKKMMEEREKHYKGVETIQKAGEEERFNNGWVRYWDQAQPQPTAEDFKNYLIEKQGLTEEQIGEISVSAIFVDNNITNFDEFFNEIGRVARG